MRPYAADPAGYDAFTRQWFEEKAMPQYVVESATKVAAAGGYDVRVRVKNTGTGRMPVEVAAVSGERWAKPAKDDTTAASVQDPDYREARGTVILGSGDVQEFTVHCDFEPKQIVVDPDVRVLQLKRKQAVAKL